MSDGAHEKARPSGPEGSDHASDAGGPLFEGCFERMDESDDARFYVMPRLVAHIDGPTITALTAAYRELLKPGMDVLDLMSSWISHLPHELRLGRVAGLGMNDVELSQNSRLDDHVVHDLNRDPNLPYAAKSFDAILNAVSIQYLTRPLDVFASAARALRPCGLHAVAMSHRCFPTKAVRAWHVLPPPERIDVVKHYFRAAGGYGEPELLDRSPMDADPLWIVVARRA
jgi:SAM-dependent methyltransferase